MSDPAAPFGNPNEVRADAPPTPEPAPGRKRRWLVPVIILSALVVIALVVVAGIGIASAFSALQSRTPQQPIVEGDPGSPDPVTPISCELQCLTAESVDSTLLSDAAYENWGLQDTTFPNGTYPPTVVSEL